MTTRVLVLGLLLTVAGLVAGPARALDVQVAGNTVTAAIALDGVEAAELILTFDGVDNLDAAALGISATKLDSLALLALASRLPDPSLTSVPAALPLLITIEPPAAGGLSLTNTVRAEIHTHLLPYTAGSSFRLFKAPLGGKFRDITDEVAPGSVRTRGTTGGFSQFLVLTDLRPTASVIDSKFRALRDRLGAVGDAALAAALTAQLDAAQAAVADHRFGDAVAEIDGFRADVSQAAGNRLPNVWHTSERGNNVAGDLLAGAASLRFSVGYLRDFAM
jgi:hypothetical protein